eukprot:gnl/TRDRNA2_/TRDRNA2_163676_c1_seq1.p1 gnl/TRDRNA2_/TRDRNA2_163676_c1~~gnl/TRDRNA2_/TRDRNA2_163676_c1_seq1.p1  ORF type:complete len:622 (-),score=88.49 gnl/TRDRNA2_/TRDRNA2_163676_c1_seq1:10-1620(-)
MVVGMSHFLLYNTSLKSMSVPAEEEFARVAQIQVDLNVTATLVGYTGPCLGGDSYFNQDDGPPLAPLTGAADDKGGRTSSDKGGHSDSGRILREELETVLNTSSRQPSSFSEAFSIQGASGGVMRHRSLQNLVASAEGHQSRRTVFRHKNEPEDNEDFNLQAADPRLWISGWLGAEDAQAEEEQEAHGESETRRLDSAKQLKCHPLVGLTSSGVDMGDGVKAETSCVRRGPRECRLSFRCAACSMSGEIAKMRLDVQQGHVFTAVREIHWSVRANWLQPDKTEGSNVKAFSTVQSVVTSADLDRCLRGSDPSTVQVTLVPTDYQDNVRGLHLYGFVTQFIDARLGSMTSPWAFHQQPAELHSEVVLHVSHSFYKLVLSENKTLFDFLAQMLGFLSGFSLIARVCLALMLLVDEKLRSRSVILWRNPLVQALSSVFFFWVPEEADADSDLFDAGYQQVDQSPDQQNDLSRTSLVPNAGQDDMASDVRGRSQRRDGSSGRPASSRANQVRPSDRSQGRDFSPRRERTDSDDRRSSSGL